MILEELSPVDAFYFSIVTVATVGYGDIHPTTQAGKVLSIILIMGGVGTFLGVIASVTELLMTKREEQIRLQRLQMVLGLFCSEVATRLLELITTFDPNLDVLQKELVVTNNWSEDEFLRVNDSLKTYDYTVDIHRGKLQQLSDFLKEKDNLLANILGNPALLEHESFTGLLQAVFHLKEEFDHRVDLQHLPDNDYLHLAGDIRRVYVLLVQRWLEYMKYLKDNYPYLFSLAMRINPFDPNASPLVG